VPANVAGGETVFPTRGVPGGWRDWWDEPDDHAQFRAQAEACERRQLARVEVLSVAWRGEVRAERRRQERQNRKRPV
jgi:hypothetical protein